MGAPRLDVLVDGQSPNHVWVITLGDQGVKERPSFLFLVFGHGPQKRNQIVPPCTIRDASTDDDDRPVVHLPNPSWRATRGILRGVPLMSGREMTVQSTSVLPVAHQGSA